MRSLVIVALALLEGVGATAASAQQLPPGGETFVGRTASRPGCPAVELHIIRSATSLGGVVFYADGSGVSQIQGTTDGKTFAWDQVSIKGKGPLGHVTGIIAPTGAIQMHLEGTDCGFNGTLPQLTDYSNG